MSWTNIQKPTFSAWNNSNPSGKQQYDETDITYNDASVFYDSINPAQWNNVARALGAELVTNGSFAGSAAGWTLGQGWVYSANSVSFTATGPELIVNGNFNGNASGWTLSQNAVYSSNAVNMPADISHEPVVQQDNRGLIPGHVYNVLFTITNQTGLLPTMDLSLRAAFTPGPYRFVAFNGTYNLFLTAGSDVSDDFFFQLLQGSVTIDSISMKASNTGALTQVVGVTPGVSYNVSVTTSGSAGYVQVDLGGASYTVLAGQTRTYVIPASTTTLALNGSTDFNGAVSMISVRSNTTVWSTIPKPM